MSISTSAPLGEPAASMDRMPNADADLVDALRAGDDRAYEELWIRYVAAARRVAARVAPSDVDDLVSEAFLAVYEQVRHQGRGPTSDFRGYLFAVIRNIGARWAREGRRVIEDPDVEVIVDDASSANLEREYDGAILLNAFRELPERWQRLLWLAEVEQVKRPVIAASLGLRPNAVSALHRRARKGLRVQWLRQQVPVELRDDPAHVASELPAAIVDGTGPDPSPHASHLATCARCRAVDEDLRFAYRERRKSAASVSGLAALGVVLPATSSLWSTAVPMTAVAAIGLGIVGSAAAVVGALLGVFGLETEPAVPAVMPATPETRPPIVQEHPVVPVSDDPPRALPAPSPAPSVAPGGQPEQAEEIDIVFDPTYEGGMTERPAPTAPEEPGTVAPPAETPEAAPAPQVASAAPSSTYLAPVLSGTAPAGADVAIGLDDDTYRTVAAEDGTWVFDLRTIRLESGLHTAQVWVIADGASSRAAVVPFTIDPLVLEGFPDYPSVTLREGMDAGLPFTMRGAPGGSVCIDSDTGQSVVVPLDESGTARRVLRFYNYGIYVLRLTPCDGAYFGPDTPRPVSVTEGIFDPWVLDDVKYWELTEE